MNEDKLPQTPQRPPAPASSLTQVQTVLGWLYLPLHMFVLPLLFSLAAALYPQWLDPVDANLAYYVLGAVFVLTVMFGFLRREFDALLDRPGRSVAGIIWALALNLVLSNIVALALSALGGGGAADNPNNAAVLELSARDFGKMKAMAVFVAPVVEEVLFRGVVFGSVRKKSRAVAYALSIATFAVYHVWQSAVGTGDPRLLLYALQYIPASVALIRCYEISGSLWACIAFHMGYNALAYFVMGYM